MIFLFKFLSVPPIYFQLHLILPFIFMLLFRYYLTQCNANTTDRIMSRDTFENDWIQLESKLKKKNIFGITYSFIYHIFYYKGQSSTLHQMARRSDSFGQSQSWQLRLRLFNWIKCFSFGGLCCLRAPTYVYLLNSVINGSGEHWLTAFRAQWDSKPTWNSSSLGQHVTVWIQERKWSRITSCRDHLVSELPGIWYSDSVAPERLSPAADVRKTTARPLLT